ncbi:hypothetical protein NEAUS04_1275 [Nematocida ausubeli]|uniref:Uncharacterized protein n=1 Tax=Nematocida ausubeli (strain ATCC PRA-371 / ERTm2) TaxID=1913371 RepID=H8ZA17_NEMA1|nr:uncharacterized protein NESG_00670 [Nematocida ausubeli]EHY66798.1 hypothetical protein NERG_00438 [Nematocida ausubeli]KAI5132372.1 hypothetical protein NEAUS07_0134 [Nematocida ausubeli]KAI5132974.1 hypothetical protein NEAUS06_0469 [Nematocida ausubeli]KAI5146921.1 hypothetical protein NEAUS05_0259 [Nematocida ausubeli]KAI5162965.1 hypothetical protein NEAUS04_1275 [Nematocida ausubeli]
MASLAFKFIRRIVNVLSFLLLLETVVIAVYTYWSRTLSRLEMYIFSNGDGGFSSVTGYLICFSLFMALLSSTAVNSKSKFTIKLALIFGIFYFTFSVACFAYIKFSYLTKMTDGAYDMYNRSTFDFSSLLAMIGKTNIINNRQEQLTCLMNIINNELWVIMIMLTCSYSLGGFITIFMIMGGNCKIRKPKTKPAEEEAEVIVQQVGFSGGSLRKASHKSSMM